MCSIFEEELLFLAKRRYNSGSPLAINLYSFWGPVLQMIGIVFPLDERIAKGGKREENSREQSKLKVHHILPRFVKLSHGIRQKSAL